MFSVDCSVDFSIKYFKTNISLITDKTDKIAFYNLINIITQTNKMSISYADMREIVAIEYKGESHKEGEDLDQFIDCMTKIRMEQNTKIEDKVNSLLNQLVVPKEMAVEMGKHLSPKKNNLNFKVKKVEEEVEEYFNPEDSSEDEDDEKQEWWYANGGNMTFITATEAEMDEIDADEWGSLYHFNDERKLEDKWIKFPWFVKYQKSKKEDFYNPYKNTADYA